MQIAAWQIEMLGGLRACKEGREPIVLSRQQTGTLLAYLALHPNRVHSRESLMALIWPDDAPEDASHKLRQSLYALCRQLDTQPDTKSDIFLSTRTTIQLDPSLFNTDVQQFEQALQAASCTDDNIEKIRLLTQAAGLYRGELLPGFYAEEFEPNRRRLAEHHRAALHDLMLAYEQTGDLKSAIETGQSVLALDPLMEEAHCDLMRVYAAQGQPSAVARQYQALASILKKELGEEPSQATAQLMESLRQRAQAEAASGGDFRSAVAVTAEETVIESTVAPTRVQEPLVSTHASAHPSGLRRNMFRYGLAALGAAACFVLALQAFGGRGRRVKDAVVVASRGAQHPDPEVSAPALLPTANRAASDIDRATSASPNPSPRSISPGAVQPGHAQNNSDHVRRASNLPTKAVSAVPNIAQAPDSVQPPKTKEAGPQPGKISWTARYEPQPGTPDAYRSGCITVKYDSKGNRLSVRGTIQERDRIEHTTMAEVNADGEVIAYGTARDHNGSPVGRVVFRDVNGLARWSNDVYSVGGEDGLAAVSSRSDGVFLCGGIRRPDEHVVEFCTVRYDNNGKQIWRNYLEAPFAKGHARLITVNRHTVAVGQSSVGGANHIAVVRYEP